MQRTVAGTVAVAAVALCPSVWAPFETWQAIAVCFPTYDAEGKKEFRMVATRIIQSMCDARVLPKEAGVRAGTVLNVPEGTRCVVNACLLHPLCF